MDEQSIWKKEISFRRKSKEPKPSQQGGEGSTPEEPTSGEPTSIWKKEISFKRKKKDAEPVQAIEPVHNETPPAEPVPAEPLMDTPELAADTSSPVQGSDPEPRPEQTADSSSPVQGSDPQPRPEQTPAEESVWKREVSFSRKVEPELVSEVPAEQTVAEGHDPTGTTPAEEAVAAPEPTAEERVAEEPVAEEPVAEAPVALESWSAKPSLPPEPVEEAPTLEVPLNVPPAAPPPTVIHPPVPAAELPPLPEEKVPFWKKEISFGGKKRDKAEKAEPKQKKQKEPKKPKEPKERKQRAPKIKAERGGKGTKRIVGLKIGASQLAAARVSNNGSAELQQVAREPLGPGIVVGGELRDPDALAESLKDFFTKHNLPRRGVRLGIANNRIGVRTFEIAGIQDQKQLANAIRFRAQEALPIPIEEAVLDYQVLGERVDEEGQPTRRILLVVAYRELIDRYVDACKKAGITLMGIDLEAFALLRALQAPQEGVGTDPSAALVAVSIGHERSTFAVSDGRVCEFTRVLEWGGSALNVAIARAVDAAPSEVEGVKRALALTDEMVPDGLTSEQSKKARDAMRRAIQTFARELVSSLQYYQNQPNSLGIGEIVLTGGTAHLPGLAGELERLIGVRVRVGDPLARMKVSKKVGEPEQIGSLAVAIGLGIED